MKSLSRTRSTILISLLLVTWPVIAVAQDAPTAAPSDVADDQAAAPSEPATPADAAPAAAAAPSSEPTADADAAAGEPEGKKKKKKKRKLAEEEAAAAAGEADDSPREGDPWEGTGGWEDTGGGALRSFRLKFRFLLQARYRHSFGVDSKNADASYRVVENTLGRNGDGWDLNRAFFGVNAEPSKYLGLKMVFDLAELRHDKPKKSVKQFYADLRPIPKHLHFVAGILKLPYSIQELDPISRYEFTGSGEANGFLGDLGFAGRDIGAEIIVSPLAKPRYLSLTAGAFRAHANDENASPIGAIGARVETEPFPFLRLGGSVVSQPKTVVNLNPLNTSGKDLLPNPDNPAYPRSRTWEKGNAFEVDLTLRFAGLMLRGEGLTGDRVDYDLRYGAKRWGAAWGIVAYRFPAGPIQLEPAVRVEYLDTDIDHAGGLYQQYSLALGTHFNAATKLVLEATRVEVEQVSPIPDQPLPLREVPFNSVSATRLTAQLQVAL